MHCYEHAEFEAYLIHLDKQEAADNNFFNKWITKALNGCYPPFNQMNHWDLHYLNRLDAFIEEAQLEEHEQLREDTTRVVRSRKVVCGSSPQTTQPKRTRPPSLREYCMSFGSSNKRQRPELHTIMGWSDWQHQGT